MLPKDGNIKLNIVNLQFMLGLKDPNKVDTDFTALTANSQDVVQTNETINLGGLQQLGSPDYVTDNGGPNGLGVSTNEDSEDKFTDTDGTAGVDDDSYIKDITQISIEEFTNIIEKIADVRAENGAEQQRVNQSLNLHQNNLVNLEAAHGRIMDVDVALESTRLTRHSVKVQASAAMVAQANQMTSVALTLLR